MGVNSRIWDNHSVLLKEGIMSYKMFQALKIVPQVFGPSPTHIQNICILSALNCLPLDRNNPFYNIQTVYFQELYSTSQINVDF